MGEFFSKKRNWKEAVSFFFAVLVAGIILIGIIFNFSIAYLIVYKKILFTDYFLERASKLEFGWGLYVWAVGFAVLVKRRLRKDITSRIILFIATLLALGQSGSILGLALVSYMTTRAPMQNATLRPEDVPRDNHSS